MSNAPGSTDINLNDLEQRIRTRAQRVKDYIVMNKVPLAWGLATGLWVSVAVVSSQNRKLHKHNYFVKLPKVQFDRLAAGTVDGQIPAMFYRTPVVDLVLLNEASFIEAVEKGEKLSKELF